MQDLCDSSFGDSSFDIFMLDGNTLSTTQAERFTEINDHDDTGFHGTSKDCHIPHPADRGFPLSSSHYTSFHLTSRSIRPIAECSTHTLQLNSSKSLGSG